MSLTLLPVHSSASVLTRSTSTVPRQSASVSVFLALQSQVSRRYPVGWRQEYPVYFDSGRPVG